MCTPSQQFYSKVEFAKVKRNTYMCIKFSQEWSTARLSIIIKVLEECKCPSTKKYTNCEFHKMENCLSGKYKNINGLQKHYFQG